MQPGMQPPVTVIRVAAPTEEARLLVEELEGWLSEFYTPEQRHGLPLEAIFRPHIRFFIARVKDQPAGCGGVALFNDFAEIKRMYVREPLRGQGIATAIMMRLESTARAADLKLETGVHQHASLRFYEKSGFRRCEAFPPYTEMDHTAISTSIFMEKRLA